MRFSDKTKKIICGVVAVVMVVPLCIGAVSMVMGSI